MIRCTVCDYDYPESTSHIHGPGKCWPTPCEPEKNYHVFMPDATVCNCRRSVKLKDNLSEAARAPVDYRYDLLDSDFLHCIAQIGAYGAAKYGDFNYQKNRLTSDKSPMNHVQMHIHQYKLGILHDHFKTRKHQLAAAAFNLMMEFFYLEHPEKYGEKDDPIQNK